jgi:hypothetical protein
MSDPRLYYETVAAQSATNLARSERQEQLISRLRLLVAVLGVFGSYLAFNFDQRIYWLLPVAAVIAFIALVRAALRQEGKTARHRNRLRIAECELQALSGDHSAFPDGAGFIDISHPYSFDLDVFGKRSVFQMLARPVTLNGADLLAAHLQSPDIDKARIEARQAAVQELAAVPEFCTDFRVTGSLSAEVGGELQQLQDWLEDSDEYQNNALIRISAIVMPLLSVAGIAVSLWRETTHPAFMLVIAVNTLLWAAFLKRIKYNNRRIGRNAAIVAKYAGLLGQISGRSFNATLLHDIGSHAVSSLQQLQVFNKLVGRFDSRNNGMAGSLMNILFLHDFRSLLQLEAWRSRNRGLVPQALNDLADFDLLTALGSYAFNHPTYNYPTINETSGALLAGALRHPLLPEASAVGNSFTIGQDENLYLLTGANMTGKSTFIRTVGVSLILGQLGVPVPADRLDLPLLRVFTSIRVTDSVQEDVSYFKAELQRIRSLFDTVSEPGGRYFVLIDEPLRGTNSGDKQEGTEAIIGRLIQEGVTGIVATHDTGLCRLEMSSGNRVRNYHFESRVDDGTLHFDFRLKPGCSTSANASLLMRQMGIIATPA